MVIRGHNINGVPCKERTTLTLIITITLTVAGDLDTFFVFFLVFILFYFVFDFMGYSSLFAAM